MVKDVTPEELGATVKQGKVLVKFYSKTCGPCKMLGFILEEISKEEPGLEIIKINFDDNKDAADQYGVSSYPTLVLFENGREIKRLKGLQQKPKVKLFIAG